MIGILFEGEGKRHGIGAEEFQDTRPGRTGSEPNTVAFFQADEAHLVGGFRQALFLLLSADLAIETLHISVPPAEVDRRR